MSQRQGILAGKRGVIMGVANKRSIAASIAKAAHEAGAEIVLTYQERVKDRVLELAGEIGEDVTCLECDVTEPSHIDSAFSEISRKFDGKLDFVVHSLAFAKRDDLEGRFVDTSRDGYLLAQEISAYSLAAVSQAAEPMLEASGGGSILTMTYIGGERVVQNYNVMGVAKAALESSVRYLAYDLGQKNIRVNAISAGPIKTLASSAIGGIQTMIDMVTKVSPLRRNTTPEEVADVALFFLSDLSRAITAEVTHVDEGFHAIGAVKPNDG